jgi:tetratricopeptide (TPR) repeat protein
MDAAVAFAYASDFTRSHGLLDPLLRKYNENTLMSHVAAPEARALEAIARHDGTAAIAALDASRPYDFSAFGDVPYVRGLAYLSAGDSKSAMAEFLKIVEHPGANPTSPSHALAHLGLGRAYALSADNAKARTAYQDFFALWKDADPDVPILIQAKSEYAKLQ